MTYYAFYPGCLISARLPFLEKSSRLVLGELDVDLENLDSYSCCADPIILKPLSFDSWLAVAARNIAIAEDAEMDLLTLCNGCFCSLNEANHILKNDGKKKEDVNEVLKEVDMEFKGSIEVLHVVQLMQEMGQERILEKVEKRPNGLRVGAHHGCHLIRPRDVAQIDDKRRPTVLDELVSWVGAEPVSYAEDLLCCGGGLMGVDEKTGASMLSSILDKMRSAGATHIVTPCPYCFVQFDYRQEEDPFPVLYLMELYGLSMGFSPDEMGLKHHRTKTEDWGF
ncbi:MAG: CoB--CoM heterodisulfide reductase subunit B [Methanobacteriota archaeon]|nr:MAG: CoB--CoM heterodisulfide reductase subunit B [Euryarchaeota archaeon]